ncbi:MAG: hypothetical protein GF330_00900 [Candidatus Eisenbacteria bacterium]|nr:hypothetical protein [Candidatus Eisenbacteria bacterium]
MQRSIRRPDARESQDSSRDRSAHRRGRWLPALAAMCALIVLTGAVGAPDAVTIRTQLDFAPPVVQDAVAEPGGRRLEVPDCTNLGAPGQPLLPARELVVLLPPGEEVVSVRARGRERHALSGRHAIVPAPQQYPISAMGPFPATPRDAAIYGSDATFPPEAARLITTQRAWGHDLAFLQVYPVAYWPQSGELAWFGRVEVEIETAPPTGSGGATSPNLRRSEAVCDRLAAMVANPEDLALYGADQAAAGGAARLGPGRYPYVIITNETLASSFEALATFQASRGRMARIVLLSEIRGTYEGDDDPERMRNFIIDAYQNWETEFVLLGGDREIIPVRNLYGDTGSYTDHFPGDCYYEGLDGTWNDDEDGYWGEEGEYDLIGEVAVGRAAVSNTTELGRWLQKNELYTESPVLPEVLMAFFAGERMDNLPTWGGDSMDEVKDSTSAHGYWTSGYPDTYHKETLYDRDGTWSKWDVIALFNDGYPSCHHLGHSLTTYNMKMYNSDVGYLTNDGISSSFTLIYTQGCYANNFDTYSGDAISEVFFYDDNGASAFIGNTRYGWYAPGTTYGASQHYNRQFVDALYDEGFIEVGWRNVDSKVDCIWQLDPVLLWCHYELCLLGDPAMPQWRDVAGALELTYETDYLMGQGDCEILVRANDLPVAGAVVTIYSEDLGVWTSGSTGLDGRVTLDPDPPEAMTLQIKAVKPDYLPATGPLEVLPPETAWLVVHDVSIDDDASGASYGDGDGLVDVGETLELALELRNVGQQPATNVALTLAPADARVEVIDGTSAYEDLGVGESGLNLDALVIRATGAGADQEEAEVLVEVTCDDRPVCPDAFQLLLHAPVLSIADWEIDDSASGDGEGDMDPDETFAIRVTLHNSGSDEARDLQALLACDSSYVEILQAEASCPLIGLDGTQTLTPDFAAELSFLAPTDAEVTYDLSVTTWAEQVHELDLTIPVASLLEEYFEEESGWTAGVPGDDATDGAWVRVDPVGTWGSDIPVQPEDDHTPDGTHCFVTGQADPDDAPMESDLDGGKTTLVSPVIDLSEAVQPRLIYWRWWTNNFGPFSGEDIWQVDVSNDGGDSWVNLEYATEGINEWQRMEFYLEDYITPTVAVVLRFVASDYDHDSLIEAAVDDIVIESLPDLSGVNDTPAGAPRECGIATLVPNPVSLSGARRAGGSAVTMTYTVPVRGAVSLQLFGVDGSLRRTLASGRHAPGEHRASWDGRDDQNRPVPSGIYFCRLRAGGQEARAKLVVVE